jgi:AcrR family transcriptional regulator
METMTTASSSRPGRPRAKTDGADTALSSRAQILDAAAALFAEAGFSGASTRAIADRVGIRQQSLYYHFSGKDEILAELLSSSVRPSIDFVESIEAQVPDHISPAGALFALASIDARTLRRTPHNIGTLYLLPEIQDTRFDAFRNQRVQLQASYGRLGVAAAHPDVVASITEHRLGAILIQIVEIVIQLRRDTTVTAVGDDDTTIAASCLRVLGLSTDEIAAAGAEANVYTRAASVSGRAGSNGIGSELTLSRSDTTR